MKVHGVACFFLPNKNVQRFNCLMAICLRVSPVIVMICVFLCFFCLVHFLSLTSAPPPSPVSFPSAVFTQKSPSSVFKLLISFSLSQILCFLQVVLRSRRWCQFFHFCIIPGFPCSLCCLVLFSSVLFLEMVIRLCRLLFKIYFFLFILPPGSQAVSAPGSSFLATSYT